MSRIAVVGAGIVGLAVARRLAMTRPDATVTVFDKEPAVATHQTGHNSGVVHAGLYYAPGSLKATLCRRGVDLLREYCAHHGIEYREIGKLVVAVTEDERARLAAIHQRALANGVPDLRLLDQAAMREVEPHVKGISALHSPRTAIVDFVRVANQFAEDVRKHGGEILTGHPVTALQQRADRVWVTAGDLRQAYDTVVVCGGLGTDRLARAAGLPTQERIVPFRGEYYRLRPEARALVRGLIYPVPDPRYPFLGVHLTRRYDDEVLVGPNAVLALAREGYRWHHVSLTDLRDIVTWPGFWALAARHWRAGVREMVGSLSKRVFAGLARRYVPALSARDLIRAPAGVRAQALDRSGGLVDDFRIQVSDRIVLVRNAPSPAATSSLAIAEYIVDRVPS
jgi:L-2-hydroxyglutarate oxidase LhgO